jgi:glutamine amidotransferase
MKIGVINYQASNLGSLTSALEELKYEHFVSSNALDFDSADLILLPGVGSFTSGMRNLTENGLTDAISFHAQKGKPILGICLGMHLLATTGREGGITPGLNLISGEVEKFKKSKDFRIPHMGWDRVCYQEDSIYVYFAHSYYFLPEKNSEILILSEFELGGHRFPAHIQRGNIAGIQFHPEKSGQRGLEILEISINNLMGTN